MADVKQFFNEDLPSKLASNPDLVTSINAIYQFDLGDGGQWVVDLTQEGGKVESGEAESPACKVTISEPDFAKLLDKPSSAMVLFTMGKLKVTNISLGMQLQKLLS